MQSTHEPAAAPGRRRPTVRKTAVYGGAVVILLVAALFARGFSRDVGDGRVAGRFTFFPLFGSRAPEELALTWNGLTLHFARSISPALTGVEPSAGGTDLVFDGDTRLRLVPGTDAGGSITLSPVSAAGAAVSAPLVIPYSVTGVLQDSASGSDISWKRAGRTFLFTLPRGARIDAAAGTVTLPLSAAAGTAVLHVEGVSAMAQTAPPRETAAANKLPAESAMPSESGLQSALVAYADAAYAGWSGSRYAASASQWLLADGSSGVTEDLGVGLLAESISRGTWQRMYPQWTNALSLHQRESASRALDATTSAYVGGVKDFADAMGTDAASRIGQARAAFERSDNAVLRTRGLVTLLVNHGTADLVAQAGTFLASRNLAGLDVPTTVGLVEALVDFTSLVRPDDTLAGVLKDAVNKKLLPAVRTTDAGVFLETSAGRSNVETGIFCGTLLARAGALINSSLAKSVGRGLLASALSLADEKGFLPAGLVLAGRRITSREGTLAPETIYPLLPLARYVPREASLASQLGPGAWLWSAAHVVSATGSADGASFTFGFPSGVPFHVIIQGIAPFELLKLHKIPWHSDPTYFKYSDGWTYDARSRTLFMKITGRSDQETIDILY